MALVLFVVWAALTTFGCAQTVAPMRVRYADLGKGALQGYSGATPLVIEFQPGDRVPVNFELTGEGFELQPQHPPVEIVATKHCFVRISGEGIRVSLDPDQFDKKPSQPGTFRIGFWMDRDQHAKLDVIIAGPRH